MITFLISWCSALSIAVAFLSFRMIRMKKELKGKAAEPFKMGGW